MCRDRETSPISGFSTLPFDMAEQVLETSPIRGFSTLPFDMVEHVLANLSLIELARISETFSAFRAVPRTQMPREQKARCNLSVSFTGHERIKRIVALIVDLLKGVPFSKDYFSEKWNECAGFPQMGCWMGHIPNHRPAVE